MCIRDRDVIQLEEFSLPLMSCRFTDANKSAAIIDKFPHSCKNLRICPVLTTGLCSIRITYICLLYTSKIAMVWPNTPNMIINISVILRAAVCATIVAHTAARKITEMFMIMFGVFGQTMAILDVYKRQM